MCLILPFYHVPLKLRNMLRLSLYSPVQFIAFNLNLLIRLQRDRIFFGQLRNTIKKNRST